MGGVSCPSLEPQLFYGILQVEPIAKNNEPIGQFC